MKLRITAQDVTNRNPQDEETPEPINVAYGRNSKLAEIQQAALDFANEFLLDYDLPSSPILRLGTVIGFEDLKRTLYDSSAIIYVSANTTSKSGRVIRFELAIPMVRGQLQRPTIAKYNEKRFVFSQDFLDHIVETAESIVPVLTKPQTPSQAIYHREKVEGPIFSAPHDPTDWSLLLSERYL